MTFARDRDLPFKRKTTQIQRKRKREELSWCTENCLPQTPQITASRNLCFRLDSNLQPHTHFETSAIQAEHQCEFVPIRNLNNSPKEAITATK